MTAPVGCGVGCSCCIAWQRYVADLERLNHALEQRAANDRRERDEALARLPHGGYGPIHADPIKRWR